MTYSFSKRLKNANITKTSIKGIVVNKYLVSKLAECIEKNKVLVSI